MVWVRMIVVKGLRTGSILNKFKVKLVDFAHGFNKGM